MPCDDCSRTESCPPCPYEEEPKASEPSSTEPECPEGSGPHCREHGWHCCHCGKRLRDLPEQPEEPPLTPEEEEEAPKDRCACGETACESELCDCDSAPCPVDHARKAQEDEGHPCTCSSRLENEDGEVLHDEDCGARLTPYHGEHGYPPQPERRPPLLVAYAVSGHLYEVALSGDASVRAVDGALVITHPLGPVAGICQVAPMQSEESHV
jgi:hypothetical protein